MTQAALSLRPMVAEFQNLMHLQRCWLANGRNVSAVLSAYVLARAPGDILSQLAVPCRRRSSSRVSICPFALRR
jgi:hypothetical protein